MSTINARPLHAYVRFDGQGRVVAGSLILRKNKPKVGKWKEINAYECCFLSTTTTSSTTAAPIYTIGESALGGKIAYILQEGDPGYDVNVQHGLVATIETPTEQLMWGCTGTVISPTSSLIGTGNANTDLITSVCIDPTIAAAFCKNLIEGGYSDWYLPSKDELNKLFLNRTAIGNFINFNYWSSTQYSAVTAWEQLFTSGVTSHAFGENTFAIRPIRSF